MKKNLVHLTLLDHGVKREMVASIRNPVDRYFLFLDVPALKLSIISIIILPTDRPEKKFSRLPVQQKIKLFSPYMYYIFISQNCRLGFSHGNLHYINSLTSARQEHPGIV